MEVKKTVDGKRMEIKLIGKFNAASAPVFEKEIAEQLEGITSIAVDMGEVDYISSAGIRALLFLQQTLDEVSGEMVIKNVPEIVAKIFEVTGIPDIITIE